MIILVSQIDPLGTQRYITVPKASSPWNTYTRTHITLGKRQLVSSEAQVSRCVSNLRLKEIFDRTADIRRQATILKFQRCYTQPYFYIDFLLSSKHHLVSSTQTPTFSSAQVPHKTNHINFPSTFDRQFHSTPTSSPTSNANHPQQCISHPSAPPPSSPS